MIGFTFLPEQETQEPSDHFEPLAVFSLNRFFLPLSKCPVCYIIREALSEPALLLRRAYPKGDVFYLRQSLEGTNWFSNKTERHMLASCSVPLTFRHPAGPHRAAWG